MLSEDFNLPPEVVEQMKAASVETRQHVEHLARTEPDQVNHLMKFLASDGAEHNLHVVCPNTRHLIISLAALFIFNTIQDAILLEKLEN